MVADLPRGRWTRHHGARLLARRRPSGSQQGTGPPLTSDPGAGTLGALPPGSTTDAILRRVAERLAPLPDDAAVLIACSGGPDSTALAVLTAQARPDLRITLAYVAHGLRGPGIDAAEQAWVAALAVQLDAEHLVLPVSVIASGAGIESDARDVRHAALEAEAARRGAVAVILGHHADDQAETLLLRIARGTGIDGLAGMAGAAGLRLRPLLDVRRSDLHRAANELRPGVLERAARDLMNEDATIARVRVRDDVLPALDRIGPDVTGALTRLAVLARDESLALEAAVAELVTSLPVVSVGAAVAVPSAGLRALPDGLARRVLRAALSARAAAPAAAGPAAPAAAGPAAPAAAGPAAWGTHRSPEASTVERLLRAPDGWRATLPGPLDAEVGRGWHVIAPASAAPVPAPAVVASGAAVDGAIDTVTVEHEPSGMRLTLAGDALGLPPGAFTLAARPSGGLPPGLADERLSVTLHDTAELTAALYVRTRRDGDRVRTPGGTRSLSDVMAEAGVPRALRDLLPVVVGEDGGVRWVPGLVVDERVRVGGARRPEPRSGPGPT